MQTGERVRYSRVFLEGLVGNEDLKRELAEMEGTILVINGAQAQVDFGSRFRATSVVKLNILELRKAAE